MMKDEEGKAMKLDKVLNSGLGIVLAVIAFLVAGRVLRVVSWSLLRICGYAFMVGIAVLAFSKFRNNN